MGATTFREAIGGNGMTPQQAYDALVSRAIETYGNNPYNGTISTTRGFVVIDAGRRSIDALVDSILSDDTSEVRKWGPAGCIEIKGRALTEWRCRNRLSGSPARAFQFFGWAAE